MASKVPVADRILDAVKQTHGCDLDTLAESVPELSWNQVFLELDRLSRTGKIQVVFQLGGRYTIRLSEYPKDAQTHYAQPS
jgi:hypothetical protein